MPASDHLRRVTLLLVGLSTALVQVALGERGSGTDLPLLGVSLALAVGLGRSVRHRKTAIWDPFTVVSVLALSCLPMAWDSVTRSLLGLGSPYEVQLAYVLRNAMLALAAVSHLPRAAGHAALASFFLTVFGYLWSHGPWSIALFVVYAVAGTWWLLAAYWDRLGGRFADSTQSNLPVRPAVATVLVLCLISPLLLLLAGRSEATTALAGFFPSSGGTQWSDPFAHGGVGDGDQMVAAKDQASSFGPIDSELFLESKMPSLYDAFNEFSEATPEKKNLRRAIPLAPSQMQTNHQKRGTTQQASREFSTVRQSAPQRHDLENRLSAALLLVSGRTPLHLGLETYDRWDGRSLIASEQQDDAAMTLRDADEQGCRWLDLSIAHPTDVYTTKARSQVRVVNLKTKRVPTPAATTAVTMKGLHAASMFSYTADGSLAMDVRYVPQLTIFEFQSALRDRRAEPKPAHSPPADAANRVATLAAEWTATVPTGWRQVETIVKRLREDYVHDRDAMVPPGVNDAVEHFLFESRRGPDYLFAASTAVLLRSLGYDTRVRSGFYASPDRFSRKSRLTPVLAEDAHFWVEVRTQNGLRFAANGGTPSGVWVTIEPTPGYDLLYAPESLLAWLSRHLAETCRTIVARPLASTVSLLALACVFASRRLLFDGLLLGWWSVRCRTAGVGKLARLTLRMLEWRAWAHRSPRPPGATLSKWAVLQPHGDFVALASWALYGSDSAAPIAAPSAREACRRAVRARFKQDDAGLVSAHAESVAA